MPRSFKPYIGRYNTNVYIFKYYSDSILSSIMLFIEGYGHCLLVPNPFDVNTVKLGSVYLVYYPKG